jgi:hypothetical protein
MSKHRSRRKPLGGTLTAVAGLLPEKGKAPLQAGVWSFGYDSPEERNPSHVLTTVYSADNSILFQQEAKADHPPVRKRRPARP